MKTLKAFWHWVDNEGPEWEVALEKSEHLSDAARFALRLAAQGIGYRRLVVDPEPLHNLDIVQHREALRDLSLSFCEALERMHEQVAKPSLFMDEWLEQMYPGRDRVLEKFQKAEALLVPSPEWVEAMVDDQIVPMHPDTYALLAEAVSSAPVHGPGDAEGHQSIPFRA